jgi:hypothetical protein
VASGVQLSAMPGSGAVTQAATKQARPILLIDIHVFIEEKKTYSPTLAKMNITRVPILRCAMCLLLTVFLKIGVICFV